MTQLETIQAARDALKGKPDPKLVALMDFAINQVSPRLIGAEYGFWVAWAQDWLSGRRSPAMCVQIARDCFDKTDDGPIWHALGQLCWAAKEACYSAKQSHWLVIRYVADAMIAFGVTFPQRGPFAIVLAGGANDQARVA